MSTPTLVSDQTTSGTRQGVVGAITGVAVILALVVLYAVFLDQGQLLSPVMGQHELLRAVTPHFRCIVDDLSRLSDQDLKARALGAFPTLVLWALRDARAPGRTT